MTDNITSASSGNSNDGTTWTGGQVPTSSQNAIIQNGHTVTQNAAHTFKSLKVESGGAWTADGSNHLTLSGEDDSDFAFAIDGTYTHSNGTVVINNGGGGIAHAAIRAGDATSTTGLYDLTISGGGTTCEIYNSTTIHRNMEAGGSETVLRGDLTVNGSLTVVGTLNTRYSSTDRNLTVVGACTLNGGTFTGNASTVSHGSLIISSGTYNATNQTTTLNGTVDTGMRVDGTFNNNDGTFVIGGSITKVQMGSIGGAPTGFSVNNAPFHHLTINDSINFAWATGTLFNVEGDLIVAAGQKLGANNANSGIKVLGDVTLNGTLGNSNLTNDCEFGSLTINSGGTYSATSGTTTLTSTSSNYSLFNGGTFTHNNGKVRVDFETPNFNANSKIECNTLNDVEFELNRTTDLCILEPEGSGTKVTVLGDLKIIKGKFDDNSNGDEYEIYGQTTIETNGTFGVNTNWHNGDITHHGLVVLNGGTYYRSDAGGTVKMGGIRNIGGSIL